jgi:hypothetical protein
MWACCFLFDISILAEIPTHQRLLSTFGVKHILGWGINRMQAGEDKHERDGIFTLTFI